jgi:hypothetical protein
MPAKQWVLDARRERHRRLNAVVLSSAFVTNNHFHTFSGEQKTMKFEKMNNDVLNLSKPFANAAATIIQTQVGPFWKNDATDDQVP